MNRFVALCALLPAAIALPVLAAETATAAATNAAPAVAAASAAGLPDVGGGLLRSIIGLAIVLAVIAGCAWLARRFGGRMTGGQSRLLKTVGALSVGQRESVVVVELGEQWLVLGVAPGRVNTLAQMPRQTLAEPAKSAAASAFAQLLARTRYESQ